MTPSLGSILFHHIFWLCPNVSKCWKFYDSQHQLVLIQIVMEFLILLIWNDVTFIQCPCCNKQPVTTKVMLSLNTSRFTCSTHVKSALKTGKLYFSRLHDSYRCRNFYNMPKPNHLFNNRNNNCNGFSVTGNRNSKFTPNIRTEIQNSKLRDANNCSENVLLADDRILLDEVRCKWI